MKFLIIKSESSYGVLRHFSDHVAEELRLLNHFVAVYDTLDTKNSALSLSDVANKFDAVLSFNGVGSEMLTSNETESTSVFKIGGIPFLAWMVDHPAYHYLRLRVDIPSRLTFCPNQDHCDLISLAGFSGMKHILLAGAMGKIDEPKSYNQRKFQATLAATWMSDPTPFWQTSYDPQLAKVVKQAIEMFTDDPEASPFNALSTAAQNHGFSIKPGLQVFMILQQMLNFSRALDRIRTVQALAKSSFPVTIVGSGWEKYTGPRGNIRFLSDKNTEEMIEIYRDSKVIFNFNAANGASERAFTGMLAGGAILSDYGKSLSESVKNQHEILFFDKRNPADIIENLGILLESPIGEKIATQGRERTLREHMWSNRVQQLIRDLDQQKKPEFNILEEA